MSDIEKECKSCGIFHDDEDPWCGGQTRDYVLILSEAFKELERQITLGARIDWQDDEWHLWREDGEGIDSGKSIEELIFKLYK